MSSIALWGFQGEEIYTKPAVKKTVKWMQYSTAIMELAAVPYDSESAQINNYSVARTLGLDLASYTQAYGT